MELELEGEDGSRIQLKNGIVFGRGCSGFNTNDRTVSRRHVVFQLDEGEPQTDPNRVPFQVIGKNPVWLWSGGTVTVFRKLGKGEVSNGDRLCVSSQNPVWFRLKRVGLHGDVSAIDPVKEFGFLVIGHEFDGYGNGRIRKAKDWDWFLVENGEGGEEEEENGVNLNKGRKKRARKRKLTGGAGGNEDEDWTGESDEDKEVVAKARKVDSTKMYATRSTHRKGEGSLGKRKDAGYNGEEKDEDDETLGGFIVDEDDKEEQVGEIDEEEEEFIDDDEEEEDR